MLLLLMLSPLLSLRMLLFWRLMLLLLVLLPQILAVNQFSSTRKRMSVLVRTDDGRTLLMVKGADNVMVDIAAPGQEVR
jgi:magnesium-transporting ATPase (P-type)